MKKKKNHIGFLIGAIIMVAGIVIALLPVKFWINNPELSYMQVVVATWKEWLLAVIVAGIGRGIIAFTNDV